MHRTVEVAYDPLPAAAAHALGMEAALSLALGGVRSLAVRYSAEEDCTEGQKDESDPGARSSPYLWGEHRVREHLTSFSASPIRIPTARVAA